MKKKQWLCLFLIAFVTVTFGVIVINYIVDPFQQYRISSWYKVTERKQRHVTPGLAKNFSYEMLVVGSSMAENFDLSYINDELNTNSLNLCLAGMTAHELHHLLNAAIKANPDIKKIVILLDVYGLSGKVTRFRNNDFPLYLYDDVITNDINYLLNSQTFKYSFKAIKQSKNKDIGIDRLWSWQGKIEYSKVSVLNSITQNKFNSAFNSADFESEVLIRSFSYNVLPFMVNNPDIEFTIVYPPYSFLAYKNMREFNWLDDVILFKRHLSLISLPNLNVHDFQCAKSITENLSNYKDITHYSPAINRYMISAIKENKYLVGPDNIGQCMETIQQSANKELETR